MRSLFYDDSDATIRRYIKEDLSKLDKQALVELQTRLAEGGYYDKPYKGDPKELIAALVSRGYLEDRGPDPMNYSGSAVQEAYTKFNRNNNIDGVLYTDTIDAFHKYYKKKQRQEDKKTGNRVDSDYVQKLHDSVYNNSTSAGVYGDPWDMMNNIVAAGGTPIYDIMQDPAYESLDDDWAIYKGIDEFYKNNKVSYGDAQPGDVVGIHNPSSTFKRYAKQKGGNHATHVGYIVEMDDDGMPIIQHKTKGATLRERADSLTGSVASTPRVTNIIRPNNAVNPPQKFYRNGK